MEPINRIAPVTLKQLEGNQTYRFFADRWGIRVIGYLEENSALIVHGRWQFSGNWCNYAIRTLYEDEPDISIIEEPENLEILGKQWVYQEWKEDLAELLTNTKVISIAMHLNDKGFLLVFRF